MTLRGFPDIGFILYAGYDITSLITSGPNEEVMRVLEQSDGAGAAVDEYTDVGMTKFDLSMDGFYDDTLIQALEALAGDNPMIYSLIGNAVGDRAIGVNALRQTISRGPSRDALTKSSLTFKSDEGHDVGHVSAPHATRTLEGPEETATDDWGASNDPSTDGAIAYLVCNALTLDSADDLQVDIIDSDDDITYGDLINFTALTAVGAQRATAAGNVERYTQTRWEFSGTPGGNQTSQFATVLVRN